MVNRRIALLAHVAMPGFNGFAEIGIILDVVLFETGRCKNVWRMQDLGASQLSNSRSRERAFHAFHFCGLVLPAVGFDEPSPLDAIGLEDLSRSVDKTLLIGRRRLRKQLPVLRDR